MVGKTLYKISNWASALDHGNAIEEIERRAEDKRFVQVLMLAMGLGTLPSLLILTKVSGALMQFGQKAWVRYLAALLLIVTAVYGLYRGMTLPAELLKGGFCLT
ncbi:MAG: hypothetical protein RIQ30_1567 [Pseudomonadota bacterium]